MGRFKITHVRKDRNDVITQVKIGTSTFDVETVVKWIDKEGDYVFTMKRGHVATVYARLHPRTKRWFLTTIPDGILENNLDFLPTF